MALFAHLKRARQRESKQARAATATATATAALPSTFVAVNVCVVRFGAQFDISTRLRRSRHTKRKLRPGCWLVVVLLELLLLLLLLLRC